MMPASVLYRPFLKINRLVVYRAGSPVYDEKFHEGVNIIRGGNGSGKSTVMDFIFHVLGGEVGEWKEYAGLCDNVIAEITANEAVLTLQREVSKDRQRPLRVFFGSFEEATTHALEQWRVHRYSRSETAESFSQILFRSLGLPEAQSTEGSNITMHQILRLLYVDQMTPVQRIFRFEAFDPPILKAAIGDLLCGIGGFDLYEKQSELRDREREFSTLSSELRSIAQVAGGIGAPLNQKSLQTHIDEMEQERAERFAELDELSRTDFGDSEASRARESDRRQAMEAVADLRAQIQVLEREIKTLEFEIEDSDRFIAHLDQMLAAMDISSVTYEELGGVRFEYCPACFTPIGSTTQHHCHLCKEALPESEKASRTLGIKIDLQIQRRESGQLQEERRSALAIYQRRLRGLRRAHLSSSAAYDALARAPISSRDTKVGAVNQRIGFINSTIKVLSERLELARRFDELSERKEGVNARISRLRDEIGAITTAQDRRRREAYTKIANFTLDFLHRDTGVQEDFVKAQAIAFSFGDDIVQVDGKSNFAASSLVILKNSFHLAMLAASLVDSKFFLPRFMMLDNIEDKGMTPNRSWNFQNLICNLSAEAKVRHQIIFTTSMVDPDLNSSPNVVGPAYSEEYRTLRIA